jgi:hypothetical protein
MERRLMCCGECRSWVDGWCVIHDERAGYEDKPCGRVAVGFRITNSELEMAERRKRRLETAYPPQADE